MGYELPCVNNGEERPVEIGEECEDCEFMITEDADRSSGNGFMSMGEVRSCEKGYWKEEI